MLKKGENIITAPWNPGKSWAERLLSFFYPERCLFCRSFLHRESKSNRKPLCADCFKFYKPGGRICPNCGGFFREAPPCNCLPVYLQDELKSMPLQALFTISLYDQKWRQVVHDLKYRNRRSVARLLGSWLAEEIIAQDYCNPDVVAPIPLHREREKERGYNQSALLAAHTAKALKVPCRQLLIKHEPTVSQTAISRMARLENVRGVFKCPVSIKQGITLLLIDDVYSTGSTMKEAAATLDKRGANVYGAVISYNPGTLALKQSGFYEGLDRW
ncbi:MAG: ComF family protein [Bacillota bacterium]